MIQATIAVYPLGQLGYSGVDHAIKAIQATGVECEVRAMQTEICGPADEVFAALRAAFDAAAGVGSTVMTVTVSNGCPVVPSAA